VEEQLLTRVWTAFRGMIHLPLRGVYDPEGAKAWLREIEKIFRVTECQDQQKVLFVTHMLADEAEYWWENTRPHLEGVGGVAIRWGTFR